MITGVSLAQVVAQSMGQGGPGAGGLIFEVFSLAAGTTNIIYGKGHTSAGADDCKYIQKFFGGIGQSAADDADHTLLAISTGEKTDDVATVTSVASVAKYVLLWGVGAEAT